MNEFGWMLMKTNRIIIYSSILLTFLLEAQSQAARILKKGSRQYAISQTCDGSQIVI